MAPLLGLGSMSLFAAPSAEGGSNVISNFASAVCGKWPNYTIGGYCGARVRLLARAAYNFAILMDGPDRLMPRGSRCSERSSHWHGHDLLVDFT